MNKTYLLLLSIIILILVLSLFNLKLTSLNNQFKEDCKFQYNLTDDCPCVSLNQSAGHAFNFTSNTSIIHIN